MKRIKAYFFKKELEEFIKPGVSSPSKRTGSILFILEHRDGNLNDRVGQITKLIKGSGFRIYFLIFDATNQLTSDGNLHIYNKKDLSWYNGFANKEILNILKQAHHLVVFPQNIFRPDFQFIAHAAASNFKIGHQDLAIDYKLDIGFEVSNDDIPNFIHQLFQISPDLLERGARKKLAKDKVEVK